MTADSNNKWKNVISETGYEENAEWGLERFFIWEFCKAIPVWKKEKAEELCVEIEKSLINNYEIMTDNIVMYANAIQNSLFREKMEQRGSINMMK